MELEPLTGPPPGRAFREALLSRWLDEAASEIPVLPLWSLGRRLAEDVEQRTRQLRRDKLDAMRELAYGASHEINNPLANIATRAQALLTGETNPDRRQRLAVIYQQAMRAHEMISDMMLFAHPPRLDCQTVSVRLILRRWIAEQEVLWTQRPGLDFRLRIGPGVDRMRLDPTQFQVALSCLVKNSIEAIEQRETGAGHIEVRLDATEAAEGQQAGLRCTVTDDGPGMDARAGQHLFDPFFSGREAGRGLGFGLSKVWRIAQQHGGWVRHDDPFQDGTRMLLWLPAQPEDAAPNPLPLEWSWPGDQDQREAA